MPQQPRNDRKCESTEALEATTTESSSAAPSSSQALASGNVPFMEEPTSCLQQPAPVEERGNVAAVESSFEESAQPQTEGPTEAQPSTSAVQGKGGIFRA